MREEADLDALITRIQSDLRSGRTPSRSAPPTTKATTTPTSASASSREARFRAELREIRGRRPGHRDVARIAARWLAPSLIFLAVLAGVLLFDRP